MTTTTTTTALEATITTLWSRHAELLSDLRAHEGRKGTTWFNDRMTALKGVRDQIRLRESMLDRMTVTEPTTDEDDELIDMGLPIRMERDRRHDLTARRAILAGLASNRTWEGDDASREAAECLQNYLGVVQCHRGV